MQKSPKTTLLMEGGTIAVLESTVFSCYVYLPAG
nr:MAG TPA: hypothetical protein [Caudoviricetes sp.]